MENNLRLWKQLELLRSQLDNERSSFTAHWRDLSDYILPRRSRFFVSDANKGDKRNTRIIDGTGTQAAGTLRSGMMAGVTSPARPWFRLTTPDPDLAEFGPVKDWLHDVTMRMQTEFIKSNLYNVLPTTYGDIGVFATGAMLMEEDLETTSRYYSFPIGSYMIANDEKLRVRVFFREFQMTVRQLVERFGRKTPAGKPDWSVFSDYVKSAWDRGQLEQWVEVCHVIRPNPEYKPNNPLSKYKLYQSVYYEKGRGGSGGYNDHNGKFLRIKGYDYFPVLVPRWETTGEDAYGTNSPGMVALGDIKQLQLGEKRLMQAVEKMINPPMVGPTSLRNQKTSILPGDITFADIREGQAGFRPAHEVRFPIEALESKQDQVRRRVQRAFYEDLFLMLASSDRRQITAREIDERHEEKLLALGPVLEQLNQDLLDPLIDNKFELMVRQDKIPPPPEEIQGMDLKVEYISIMAQAQKLVGLSGIERFTGYVGQVAQADPQVLDKVDRDQLIDVYGDLTGIPPQIVKSDEEVAEIRAQRQQAQQAQMKQEQMLQGAQAAKTLSDTKMEEGNALNELISQARAGQVAEI